MEPVPGTADMGRLAGTARPAGRSSLYGRRNECEALDRLLAAVRNGRSGVLVLQGEAGVGKTALLDYVAGSAADLRVVRTAGVQPEMELAFASLHQLFLPVLDQLAPLPGPQREALDVAFGRAAGPVPDRFLVGLAVLSLLAEASMRGPLVCVIDDAHWLDQASAQALTFAARRLLAEPVLMVFATQEPGAQLAGLPELAVRGLRDADARALLASVARWPLDERIRDRIVAETRGNPLALLELPRGLSPGQLAGGLGLLHAAPVPGRIEQSFLRQLDALPAQTRRLLVVAAAEPAGDPALLWRGAGQLGIPMAAATPATQAGLVEFGARVVFRHPLVRSAVYRAAPWPDRRDAHRVLADATDPATDPDRRAWHRAHSVSGPDEEIALELERAAGRARARGGAATVATLLERAAELTPDPDRRAPRIVAAAAAMVQAGVFDVARDLLAAADNGSLDPAVQAHSDLVRAKLAFVADRDRDAPLLLLQAARRLEPDDPMLARATYLEAVHAAVFAGHLAGPGAGARDVVLAVRAALPPADPPQATDLLLEGLATSFGSGYRAAVPILRRALDAAGSELPGHRELGWLWLSCLAATHLWDEQQWDALTGRHARLARDAGNLSELPLGLTVRVFLLLFTGELTMAASIADEVRDATEATLSHMAPYCALALAAVRGQEPETRVLIEATEQDVAKRGEGIGITAAKWAAAILNNGLERYGEALAAATAGSEYPDELGLASWSAVELIEAAVRAGQPEQAGDALRRLTEMATASGTDWALGLEARSRALVSQGEAAGQLYQTAIERLGRTRMRLDLARAHLLYGEWLRQQGQRTDAREHLRRAHQMLTSMGADGFAERARRELAAAGESAPRRTADPAGELTAQEVQIAVRARAGQTNSEIGAELFLSPRTVEWHLRKVFAKLGISSRRQLDQVLSGSGRLAG